MVQMAKALENKSTIFFITLATALLGAVGMIKIGGTVAIVIAILYCAMTAITGLGVLAQIHDPKTIGMRIGIVRGSDGVSTVDLKIYDEYMHVYEHRMSSMWFWLLAPLALAWPVIFLLAGFTKLAYVILASIIFAEIGKYRVYKAIKENKTAWGAAAYINEIRNFFDKNVKENNK